MTDNNKNTPAAFGTAWFVRIAAIGFPIVVAAALGWYFHPSSPAGKPAAPATAQPSMQSQTRFAALAVAQRRGRCRALNHHLTSLAHAKDRSEVETALRMMGLLTGEMMNGYPKQAPADQVVSFASPIVNTPDGQRGLLEARDALRDTLREVRGMDGRQAAARVSESCTACHSRFMRSTGQPLPPLSEAASKR